MTQHSWCYTRSFGSRRSRRYGERPRLRLKLSGSLYSIALSFMTVWAVICSALT